MRCTKTSFKPFLVSAIRGTWNSILHYSKKNLRTSSSGHCKLKIKIEAGTQHIINQLTSLLILHHELLSNSPYAFHELLRKCLRRWKKKTIQHKISHKRSIHNIESVLSEKMRRMVTVSSQFSTICTIWHVQTIMNSSTLQNILIKQLFSSTVCIQILS